MLYFLGGAPRAGKSAISRQFLKETGTPFFCLDYLMMGFANGLPALGVDPEDDELAVGERLWPVVKPMAVALIEDEVEYLIEGVQLNPKHVAELYSRFPGQVTACFVGYAEIDVRVKLEQLQRFGGGLDDWMRAYDEQQRLETVAHMKQLSARVRDECRQVNLRYFETDTNLEQTVSQVVQYLKQKGSVRLNP